MYMRSKIQAFTYGVGGSTSIIIDVFSLVSTQLSCFFVISVPVLSFVLSAARSQTGLSKLLTISLFRVNN